MPASILFRLAASIDGVLLSTHWVFEYGEETNS